MAAIFSVYSEEGKKNTEKNTWFLSAQIEVSPLFKIFFQYFSVLVAANMKGRKEKETS